MSDQDLFLERGEACRQPQGNVVVIPGILGSHLAAPDEVGRGQTIWLSPLSLLHGGFARLRIDRPVRPLGVLRRYYGPAVRYLEKRWTVHAFAYDWRQTPASSAALLARSIDQWFGPEAPVHLVAHSMGGLVARAYAAQFHERWKRGGRLIMLGTPNRGSYAITQLLHGLHPLLKPLALLDTSHSLHEIREIIAQWPGVREMSPGFDHPGAVCSARMDYIAGSGHRTAVGIRDPKRLNKTDGYLWSEAGDGTVPHTLGLLPDVPTYYCDAEHGRLASDTAVLAAIDQLLETGACPLPRVPAGSRSGIKTRTDPVDAAVAGFLESPAAEADAPSGSRRLHVKVQIGQFEAAPVAGVRALGYYAGVEPRASEPVGELLAHGLLTGQLAIPLMVPGEPPELLMGMGPVGTFGVRELDTYVRRVAWTLKRFGYSALTTLLTGAGSGNLSLEDAAGTWMRALAADPPDRIHFVERDSRRARALHRILAGLQSEAGFALEPLAGAALRRRKRPCEPSAATARLTIETLDHGYRIALLTSEASIPERIVSVDRSLIDDVNRRLVLAPGEWADVLLRLLFPGEVREAFRSPQPLVVACDRAAAGLHWELLRTGPVSRQLRTLRAPVLPPAGPCRRALLVADTCAESPLPGARQEGIELSGQLSSCGLQVTALIGPEEANRAAVVRELFLGGYDILHFAGHCAFDARNPAASGWVFSGGARLSASELARLERVPQFVFSNACESGAMERAEHDAPAFAEAFFSQGVRNLICTARPVGDGAARRFAVAFYAAAGEPLHAAMRTAREALDEAASWQHYGNPATRLIVRSTA